MSTSVNVTSFPTFLSYLAGSNCLGKMALIPEGSRVTTALTAWHVAKRGGGGAKDDFGGDCCSTFVFLVWSPWDCCQRHWPLTCCQGQAMEKLAHYGQFALCTCIHGDLPALPWPWWDCFTWRSWDWGISPGDWGGHDKPHKTTSYSIRRKVPT